MTGVVRLFRMNSTTRAAGFGLLWGLGRHCNGRWTPHGVLIKGLKKWDEGRWIVECIPGIL